MDPVLRGIRVRHTCFCGDPRCDEGFEPNPIRSHDNNADTITHPRSSHNAAQCGLLKRTRPSRSIH
jgi:hypothetical protein